MVNIDFKSSCKVKFSYSKLSLYTELIFITKIPYNTDIHFIIDKECYYITKEDIIECRKTVYANIYANILYFEKHKDLELIRNVSIEYKSYRKSLIRNKKINNIINEADC
jgi:hypothetical protein